MILTLTGICGAQTTGEDTSQSGSSSSTDASGGFGAFNFATLGAAPMNQYMASPYFVPPFAGGTRFLPAVSVRGGYDSNAFFGLQSGGSDQRLFLNGTPDYFINTTGSLIAQHSNRYVDGAIQGSFSSFEYIRNNDLSYTGWQTGAVAVLDKTVKQFVPAAGVALIYNGRDTQQVYAFDPNDPSINPTFDPNFNVSRGIQTARARTKTHTGTMTAYYDVSSYSRVRTSYSYAENVFGVPQRGQIAIGNFFSTRSHAALVANDVRLRPTDMVTLQYQFTDTRFSPNEATILDDTNFFSESFKTHAVVVNWLHQFSPTVMGSARGGATYMTQSQSAGGSGVAFLGGVSVTWIPRIGTMVGVDYSRGIYPSFVVGAGPSINDTVMLRVNHLFSPRLIGVAAGGYSRNTTPGFATGQNDFTFISYQANAALKYQLFQYLYASADYLYGSYDQAFETQTFQYDRHVVTVGLTTFWQ